VAELVISRARSSPERAERSSAGAPLLRAGARPAAAQKLGATLAPAFRNAMRRAARRPKHRPSLGDHSACMHSREPHGIITFERPRRRMHSGFCAHKKNSIRATYNATAASARPRFLMHAHLDTPAIWTSRDYSRIGEERVRWGAFRV
jgi:hypothetical protein